MKEQENNLMPEEQVNENPVEDAKEPACENTPEQELNEELENIAELFRTELAKAQEAESEDGVTAEENDEAAEETQATEGTGQTEEVALCACCGEEPKPENGDYCEKCIENMRHYPIGFANIIIAVLITVMAGVSAFTFFQDVEGYSYAYEAKKDKADGFLTSSLENYDMGISFFKSRKANPTNLYFESAEVVFNTMSAGTSSMNDVAQRIEDGIGDSNPNLFIYKNNVDMRNESMVLYGTMKSFYDIMNSGQYSTYEAVMAEVEKLVGTELTVTSIDGKTEQKFTADEGMLRFCQYMYAYTSGQYEDAEKYLRKVYELKSDYVWLYAYELAFSDIKSGNLEEAKKLADAICENNKEESDSYCLNSAIARMSGDTEGAIKFADEGLKYCPTDAEILRNKAMAYVAAGDIKNAGASINEALSYNQYGLLYYTAIVIENEQGNKESVEEMKKILEDNGIPLSERLNSYLGGKITAKQLFTEGTGEVE
ncbi:MAG: tetratricopeptide repeat protein [Clostridia bacterium]|nr:tetratricopeptide repeat protein [Clostridia bacterium]